VASVMALTMMPSQTHVEWSMKDSKCPKERELESGAPGVDRLPVGIVQGPASVEFWVIMVNEPGAKTPERGRRSVRAENTTILRLKKNAQGSVLYNCSWHSI